jgi:DNA-binding response OmpR family regulator
MHAKLILIVDDDPEAGEIISRCIQKDYGQEFLIFYESDPVRAIKFFQSILPDILITDYDMPGKNGVELAVAAREIHPGLPILMISGIASQKSDIMSIMKTMGVMVLSKPFQREKVCRWMDGVVSTLSTRKSAPSPKSCR